MKEKIEKFKELWAVPRYKAIIELIMFFIFFAVIFLIMFIMSLFAEEEPIEIKKSTIENFTSMENYEYIYEINYIINKETLTKEIKGTKYDSTNNFKILSDKYYIKDNSIFNSNDEIVTNINEYDLIELEPINIVTKLNEIENKNITTYNDGKIKTEYNSDLYSITTYEEDNYIYEIDLDLTNKIKETNNKITYYSIKITYTNINNINSYD